MQQVTLRQLSRDFRERHKSNRQRLETDERRSDRMHLILASLTVAVACLVFLATSL